MCTKVIVKSFLLTKAEIESAFSKFFSPVLLVTQRKYFFEATEQPTSPLPRKEHAKELLEKKPDFDAVY